MAGSRDGGPRFGPTSRGWTGEASIAISTLGGTPSMVVYCGTAATPSRHFGTPRPRQIPTTGAPTHLQLGLECFQRPAPSATGSLRHRSHGTPAAHGHLRVCAAQRGARVVVGPVTIYAAITWVGARSPVASLFPLALLAPPRGCVGGGANRMSSRALWWSSLGRSRSGVWQLSPRKIGPQQQCATCRRRGCGLEVEGAQGSGRKVSRGENHLRLALNTCCWA